MPVAVQQENRKYDTVRSIKIEIGDEKVSVDFGRNVSMSYARKHALHHLNIMTGEPSDWNDHAAKNTPQ